MLLNKNLKKIHEKILNNQGTNQLIRQTIDLVNRDSKIIDIEHYKLMNEILRAAAQSEKGINPDLSELTNIIERAYNENLAPLFGDLPVFSLETYLGGKRIGEFEKIEASKKRNFTDGNVAIIRAFGDGNCGSRAIIQALLIQGIIEDKKDDIAKFINDLVDRTEQQVLSSFKLKKPDNFNEFIDQYREMTPGEKVKDFFVRNFPVNYTNKEEKPVNDSILYFLNACLRKDAAFFYAPDWGQSLKEVNNELDELNAEIDLPTIVPYLQNHRITLAIYRVDENKDEKGVSFFGEIKKDLYPADNSQLAINILWKRPHFDVLILEKELTEYKNKITNSSDNSSANNLVKQEKVPVKLTKTFNQGNLIIVPTQNNFCGYYVLARRLINDNNCNILLDKFNQFYQTNWDNEQLTQVLDNMHPAQAEVMLGLVLQKQFPNGNQGLELYELGSLCKKLGYNLFIAQQEHLPESIESSLFNSQEYLPNGKKILVLFTPKKSASKLGDYYLVEPDNEKAALDASVRGTSSQDEFTYAINNKGLTTQIFIKNIKQSVTSINQQLTAILPSETETDKLNVDNEETFQIEDDEKFAWKTAFEEAEKITSKEKLNSFKQPLFFKGSDLKKYVLDLQTKEIEYYEKLQSECKRASQKKA